MNALICLLAALFVAAITCAPSGYLPNEEMIVKRLQEYLRIESITDSQDPQVWEAALNFFQREASNLSLEYRVVYPRSKPVVVITMEGKRPELPSIMMNSHMDVVPIEIVDEWNYPPFGAEIDGAGNIFARGVQDCKALAIQQLEVFRYFKESGTRPLRTLHMTVMSDEETGGFEGMLAFINTTEFQNLNVGFALDEGLATSGDDFYATYLDKRPWQMKFSIRGSGGGHGSVMLPGNVVEYMVKFLNEVLAFRREQMSIAASVDTSDYGAYTTINVNVIRGGVATNVVPTLMTVVEDMRLSVDANVTEMQEMVNAWLRDFAGENSTVEFIRKETVNYATAVDDTNPFWMAMKNFSYNVHKEINPVVCPATSDMVHLRALGIPAIGFAPNINTTSKMHGTNEYLNKDVFLNGCSYYIQLIKLVSSVN